MFKKSVLALTATAALSMLTGCASIVNGTSQPVSVHTGNIQGATCSLENNKGTWYASHTPATVMVTRSYHDLRIICQKKGYKHSAKAVQSKTKAMAFGNIIFGGVIGAGVDVVDGAAYDYPTNIYVPMRRVA